MDAAFGEFFTDGKGAPALPTRLVAGLHYLKHAFGHSDEEVVALWVETPYWQHLCGERFFQHRPPCHPTSLTKWRNRIGGAGCEWLLSTAIQAGVDTQTVNPKGFQSVTVDSTVQDTHRAQERPSLTRPTASCTSVAASIWPGWLGGTASSYGRNTAVRLLTCC